MKDITELSLFIKNIDKALIPELERAQQETAKKIEEDVKASAPVGTGQYSNSIKTRATETDNKSIRTRITSTLTVGPAKSTGKSYLLGSLLENGTSHHAIPNAFDWGRIYGYDSEQYQRTLDPNWHPGFVAMPHWQPALDKNKKLYLENIGKALDGVFKNG